MFLPPAVIMMSFLRSTIRISRSGRRRPSRRIDVHPFADVAGVQPAVGVDDLARGLLVAVVALEDGAPAHQHLAVVGELHLDRRACRTPTVPGGE